MRVLAVLAGYPLWKYQASVILGRGSRYVGLVLVGATFSIPGTWILIGSLILLGLSIRGARRMNRGEQASALPGHAEALQEEG
jgi:hypothetical protein